MHGLLCREKEKVKPWHLPSVLSIFLHVTKSWTGGLSSLKQTAHLLLVQIWNHFCISIFLGWPTRSCTYCKGQRNWETKGLWFCELYTWSFSTLCYQPYGWYSIIWKTNNGQNCRAEFQHKFTRESKSIKLQLPLSWQSAASKTLIWYSKWTLQPAARLKNSISSFNGQWW